MTEFEDLQREMTILQDNQNQVFLLLCGVFVLLMQSGFALLEAGSVRSKNTVNILIKNILDMFIGAFSFWAFGYAFAYGDPGNSFIGHNYFFSTSVNIFEETNSNNESADNYFANWFFQFVFAATSATIVSGAMAERTEFSCYIIYSFSITGFIYPVIAHWVWSDRGWLSTGSGTGISMHDFAGSSVVHLCGGTAALVGTYILGPRIGRFSPSGELIPIPGHSVPLASLGGFLLIVGFLCFNGGSLQSASREGDGAEIALSMMNTILGGSSGGLVAMLVNRLYSSMKGYGKYWSLLMTINGGLAGMVSMSAACNDIEPWAALVIGALAGLMFKLVQVLVLKFKIDDPLDAVAVHMGGGFVGGFTAPIFALRGQKLNGKHVGGLIYSGHSLAWKSLGWNLLGMISISIWSGLCCFVIFYTLKLIGLIRITEQAELIGIDETEHGEHAYPENCSLLNNTETKSSIKKKKELKQMKPPRSSSSKSGTENNNLVIENKTAWHNTEVSMTTEESQTSTSRVT